MNIFSDGKKSQIFEYEYRQMTGILLVKKESRQSSYNFQESQQNKFIASFCDNLTLRVYDTRESDKTDKSASIQRVTVN